MVTRRAVCAAPAALFALSVPRLATGSDAGVRDAISEDFGVGDIPDGDVWIDMPDFSDSGKSVPLSVTVPCSMEGLDYPEAVAVYADRNPRPRVLTAHFTPLCSKPVFSTRVRIDSFQDITVVARMASGEIFKAVKKVDVTYGACEEAVANDQFPPGWSPRIRLAVPETAAAGDSVEIRTIIGHPMETGFRHNSRGLLIPVRIAETFECFLNDDLAFWVKLEPAVSANPYFAFNLRIEETSHLRFKWVDTTSDIYADDATITVE